jgi:hypothetical protein
LCEQALINHKITSFCHFEADGVVEKMVQMVKKGLQKYGLQND